MPNYSIKSLRHSSCPCCLCCVKDDCVVQVSSSLIPGVNHQYQMTAEELDEPSRQDSIIQDGTFSLSTQVRFHSPYPYSLY